MTDVLPSLDRSNLRERALSALRSAITTGQYQPGEHLGEVELANQLGVSRGTIREALRHLQQEGLVVPGARGMLRVLRLSATEVLELYRVRASLEALAAEEVIASSERLAHVEVLRGALSRLDAAEGDLVAQVEVDLAFHLLLCTLSGNSVLVSTWRHIEGPVRTTVMHAGPERALHNMAARRHAPIVDAIEAGDTALAVEVLREHMASAAQRLAQAVADG